MSTALSNPPTVPPRRRSSPAAVAVVTGDVWEPQMLHAVFRRGRISVATAAAGPLTYVWPTNEFQAAAPIEGAPVLVVFDPIIAEEVLVFSPSIGAEDPVFLGVAEIESPEPTENEEEVAP